MNYGCTKETSSCPWKAKRRRPRRGTAASRRLYRRLYRRIYRRANVLDEALVDDHSVDVFLGAIGPSLQATGLGDETDALEAKLVPQAQGCSVVCVSVRIHVSNSLSYTRLKTLDRYPNLGA